MCRKLCFLMCFVLVLGLSGAAQATAINDCRYNLSFELMIDPCDPNNSCDRLVDDHTSTMDDVLAWEMAGSASFAGVDVNCGHECPDCDCRDWGIIPDGNAFAYMQAGKSIYQVLDPAFDGNAIIQVGKKYTLTFDATVNSDSSYDLGYSLFYGDDYEANQITSGVVALVGVPHPSGLTDWTYDLTLSFVSTPGPAIGEKLGIRFDDYLGQTWLFVDDVRMDWVWATSAYGPSPADGAEDLPRDVNLTWEPGLWADDTDGHRVYFGTSLADVQSRDGSVYFGVQSPNSFDPTPGGGQLVLGETYYWAIDEVNDTWPGIPGVPDPPWVGDVWSFEVTGYATSPYPADGAEDVQFKGTILSWTPGTDSNSHDVYFGTDEDDVSDANTSVTLGVFIDNNEANSYDPGALLLGKTYYWRIDEVNETAGTLMKGKLWEFTVAPFLPVDDFDSYPSNPDLYAVWKDGAINGSGAAISMEFDANYTEDGNSMYYEYANNYGGYYSEAYADTSVLGITSNWSTGGLNALRLAFRGQAGNALDDMYVALTDSSNRTGKVVHPDSNELAQGWKGMQEWNILLSDFVDDNSVNLSNISRITLGFGDKTAGGTGTVHFDNIRLYPSRCVPEYALDMGSFDGDGECLVDEGDLKLLAERDWLLTAIGNITAVSPNNASTSLVGHWPMDDDDPQLQVDDISGNANHGLLYDEDRFPGRSTAKHSMDDGAIGKALTFDGFDDYVEIQPLNLNTNTMTISAWVKREGSPNIYSGIVFSSDPCSDPDTTGGIMLGADTDTWEATNELAYMWTGDAWSWHTGLFVPDYWCFVAVTIAPDVATVYLDEGLGLKAARNYVTHEVRPWAGLVRIGDQMQYEERIFKGAIDDVRIYNYTLTPAEILYLALQGAGSAYVELPAWRADTDGDDKVNFKDFGTMADNWLHETFWP